MNELTIYHAPLTCARVALVALEESGTKYANQLINVMKGEQKSPAYLAIHPDGKVPALRVGDRVITENAAILLYLHARFPEAGLLPLTENPLDRARAWSDLVWCSSTLHPIARQIRAPFHYTNGNTDDVAAKGRDAIGPIMLRLQDRFSDGSWWYGERWSIIDAYLSWVFAACSTVDFDASAYPAVAAHSERMRSRPSFQRMLDRERAAMEAAGVQLPRGVTL